MKFSKSCSDAMHREGLDDLRAVYFECFLREQAREDAGEAAVLAFVRVER